MLESLLYERAKPFPLEAGNSHSVCLSICVVTDSLPIDGQTSPVSKAIPDTEPHGWNRDVSRRRRGFSGMRDISVGLDQFFVSRRRPRLTGVFG